MTQPRDLSALRAMDPHTGKPRHKTREVRVGDKIVGGDNPIWVQSMTTTDTHDVEATVAQIQRLEEAGLRDRPRHRAQAGRRRACLTEIKQAHPHAAHLRHPLRLQDGPGGPRSSGRQDPHQPRQHRRLRPLSPGDPQGQGQGPADAHRRQRRQPGARAGREARLPLPAGDGRERPALHRDRRVRGLSRHDRVAEVERRDHRRSRPIGSIAKQATTRRTSASPRRASRPTRSPSRRAGLAPILLDGIGDTIRISLLGDPVPEIAAAFDILQATQRRVRKPELIACPTCGRLEIDLEKIIAELREAAGRARRRR